MIDFPPSLSLIEEDNNVTLLRIENSRARACVSLFGAHLLSFKPEHDQRERLFLSNKAQLDGSTSIRGGIPICWPWFGDHPDSRYPAHGYVRNRQWELTACHESEERTELVLSPGDTAGNGFTGHCRLELAISIGESLVLALSTENTGPETVLYHCALHSYFKVQDIGNTTLEGLSGEYSDKTRNWSHFTTPQPYVFCEETDRIHLNPVSKITIKEPDFHTAVLSSGHDSLVVWNPWQQKSAEMPDMADDDYKHMLCVETAITRGHSLEPGMRHTLQQIIR